MASVNKVILIGRLGKDPVMKATSTGLSVATLSVATTERWTDKTGEKKEQTEWHRVIAWNKLAEISEKLFLKGKQIYVEGKLKTRSWKQEGITKYITEIIAIKIKILSKKEKPFNSSEEISSDPLEEPYNTPF